MRSPGLSWLHYQEEGFFFYLFILCKKFNYVSGLETTKVNIFCIILIMEIHNLATPTNIVQIHETI